MNIQRLLLSVFLLLSAASVLAQMRGSSGGQAPCAGDINRFCAEAKQGGERGAIAKCLQAHESELSSACRERLTTASTRRGGQQRGAQQSGGQESGELEHEGRRRSYVIYTPSSYQPDQPTALVLILHGGRGNPQRLMRNTAFDKVAEKRGFVAVFPQAAKGEKWNDGRKALQPGVDDISFLAALLDHLQNKRNIDTNRIYAVGPSNGGGMAFHLACKIPERFAAFAAVSVNLNEGLVSTCQPPQPVNMLIMNGVDDPLMPWKGGELKMRGRQGSGAVGGHVLSAPETAKFWAKSNDCDGEPSTRMLPDKDPNDGTRVEETVYANCRDGTEVILLGIHGGGHTWPGSPLVSKRREQIAGRSSRDINASETAWEFFERHRRTE